MKSTALLYRLLGDEARLRLLRVLVKERLNVTELTGVLGLAQSGVSRHLGLLKDAGLVGEERDGGFSYYRLSPALESGDAKSAAEWGRNAGKLGLRLEPWQRVPFGDRLPPLQQLAEWQFLAVP